MSFRHIATLATLFGTAALALAQTTVAIDVNEPRPLLKAIDMLETKLGVAINYEDPPYANMADLQRISLPGCATCTAVVPRSVHITASIPMQTAGAGTEGDAVNDVDLLLGSYAQGTVSGAFKLVQANEMIYIIPTSVLNENGAAQPISSPLMTIVNVPYARRSVTGTINAILAQVTTATGYTFGIATPFVPPNIVEFSASNIPARDALAQLFVKASPVPMSYRLNFNPKPDPKRRTDYAFNVHALRVRAPVPPTRPQFPAPKSSTGRGPGQTTKPQ